VSFRPAGRQRGPPQRPPPADRRLAAASIAGKHLGPLARP